MSEIEELFPFYALGVLSEEEKARVETYVSTDASAHARLLEMTKAAQALPFEPVPAPPSKSVKASLMARVRADAAAPSFPIAVYPSENSPTWLQRIQNWFLSPTFSALAFASILLLVIWVVRLQAKVGELTAQNQTLETTVSTQANEYQELQAQVELLMDENEGLQDELLSEEQVLALLAAPERYEIPITGTDHQPDAHGTLLVGSTEGLEAVLIVANLPSLPAGSVYQFWLIKNSVPVGAGMFHSNAQGQGLLVVHSQQPVLSFDTIGVSIEPDGGSQSPTGNIVLLGNLSESGGS